MKKAVKIVLAAVIAAVMLLPFARVTAGAYSTGTYRTVLHDGEDYLSSTQWDYVKELMQPAADAARCHLMIYLVSTAEVDDVRIDRLAAGVFGDGADIIALYYDGVSDADGHCEIYMSGAPSAIYAAFQSDLCDTFEDLAANVSVANALYIFCGKIEEYGKAVYTSDFDGAGSAYNSEYANSDDRILTKGEEWKAALADYDDCLTASEEEEVLDYMEETARKTKCNIGIIITRDLGGVYSRSYTEAFLDDNFGITSDSVVLMLLNKHDNPEYQSQSLYKDWISLSGKAEQKLQRHTNDIFDDMYNKLYNYGSISDKDYDNLHFCNACTAFCKSVRTYSGFGFMRIVKLFADNPAPVMMAFSISIVLAIVITISVASKYKKKKPLSAAQYIDRRTVNVTYRRDDFIREYTTSVCVSSGSHGGGGHGGGGGGHHGGGGGRSR